MNNKNASGPPIREWWVKLFDLVSTGQTEHAKALMRVLPRLQHLQIEEVARLRRIRAELQDAGDDDDRRFLVGLVDRLDEEVCEVEYCYLDRNATTGGSSTLYGPCVIVANRSEF